VKPDNKVRSVVVDALSILEFRSTCLVKKVDQLCCESILEIIIGDLDCLYVMNLDHDSVHEGPSRLGLAFLASPVEVVFLRNNAWSILRESDWFWVQMELQNNRRDVVDRRGDETKLCGCTLGASHSATWKRVNTG
jgi:hypothetical protein